MKNNVSQNIAKLFRNITILSCLIVLVFSNANAGPLDIRTDTSTDTEKNVLVAFGGNYCSGYAQCGDGRTVTCETYGSGCSWQSYPGVGVTCTGFRNGAWLTFWNRC